MNDQLDGAAVAAAFAAANEHIGGPPAERMVLLPEVITEDRVRRIVAAALPHLTAAAEPGLVLRGDEVHRALDAARAEGAACEREDCALLAEQHNARYLVRSEDFADGYPSGLEPFADLIRARRVVTAVTAVTAAAGRQS